MKMIRNTLCKQITFTLLLPLLIISLLLPAAPALVQTEPLRIVALNFPAFDFSRVIAGNRAQVTMLLPPGTEAHSFEPTPKDLIALQQADLLVFTGGHADFWVEKVVQSFGDNAPRLLRMMDAVKAVEEELIEGMEDVSHIHADSEADSPQKDDHEEDAHGDHDHGEERELDEHVWTSPINASLIASAIARELEALDPQGKDTYRLNLQSYVEQLHQLDLQFRQLVDNSKRKTIVLGDRFPMRYFTAAYGLSYYAAFPGCASQTEPNAKTIAFLISKVREEHIPVVFYIEFSSGQAAQAIAIQTGAKTALLHSIHNVSQKELDEGVSYLSLMRQNLEALREALN